MEYNTPSSYKNYLPSKKIRIIIGILIVIGLGYFTIPLIIKSVKREAIREVPPTNLVISTPTGDPTTRDTDSDGVPDWQEIAMGLDPNKPQTKDGVADMTTFQNIKNAVGNNTFDLEAGKVTDTDKVSLTIYDALASDSKKNNGVSVEAAQAVTGQELYNYIAAQKKQVAVYTTKDINVTEGTLESNKDYAAQMKVLLADTPETKKYPTTINTYLDSDSTKDKSAITPVLAYFEKTIVALKSTPVPSPAASTHLDILNAIQGVYQIVKTYNPTDTDPTSQVSAVSLVQDYLISLSKSLGMLSVYFSVSLDKNGYNN
ncbi:MAG: hypothetical protein WCG20_02235 [bacterium]